eukprot:scaffold281326_cov32-Tisochrysis_lutea.AAC.2
MTASGASLGSTPSSAPAAEYALVASTSVEIASPGPLEGSAAISTIGLTRLSHPHVTRPRRRRVRAAGVALRRSRVVGMPLSARCTAHSVPSAPPPSTCT